MSNFFSELNEYEQKQKKLLEAKRSTQVAQNHEQVSEQVNEQHLAHSSEDLSKPLSSRSIKSTSKPMSKRLSKSLSICIETEDVETFAFEVRKRPKSKVNTEIPSEWKAEIDQLAMELGVGKYDLIAYILATYLGHTKNKPL